MVHQRTFWDKFWRDEHGRDVIWQRPNKLLLIWFATGVLRLLIRGGFVEDVLKWTGVLAILLWAIIEASWGVNYFRRSLGIMVLIVLAFSYI